MEDSNALPDTFKDCIDEHVENATDSETRTARDALEGWTAS